MAENQFFVEILNVVLFSYFYSSFIMTEAQNHGSIVQHSHSFYPSFYLELPNIFPEHVKAFSRVSMSNSRMV